MPLTLPTVPLQDLEEVIEKLSFELGKPARAVFENRRLIMTLADSAMRRVQVMVEGIENGFADLGGVEEAPSKASSTPVPRPVAKKGKK